MRKRIHSSQEAADVSTPNSSMTTAPKKVMTVLRLWQTRWVDRYRLRRQLGKIHAGQIEQDIGAPTGALFEEAFKPFWRE